MNASGRDFFRHIFQRDRLLQLSGKSDGKTDKFKTDMNSFRQRNFSEKIGFLFAGLVN